MAVIWLTDDEKNRFADYLAQGAAGDEGIAAEMEKLGPSHGHDAMVKLLRTRAIAKKIVERELRSGETQPIKGAGT